MTYAPIKVRNPSSKPQVRFCRAMVPTSRLNDLQLGRQGLTQDGWLWQRGAEVGEQTRLWMRSDLAGGELRSTDLSMFKTVDRDLAWLVPAMRFDWLLDHPTDAVLKIAINDVETVLSYDGLVENGPLVKMFRFKARGQGFYAIAIATVPVGQDVFDVEGFVVWDDRRTQSVMLSNVRLELRHGERHAAYLVRSLGQSQPVPGRTPHVLLDGSADNWIPTAMAVVFYGALIAEQDLPAVPIAPAPVDATDVAASVATMAAIRENNALAAMDGPVLALAGKTIWNGRVGPHKATLDVPFAPLLFNFVDQQHSYWDPRPHANPSQSGQTGDQGIFGRIKGLHLFCDADPSELLELRRSSTDYFARSHHFLDTDCQPLSFDDGLSDPKTTYGTAPFWRGSGSAWGKNFGNNDPPWGWDHGERAYLDWQHRGNLYMPIALMLLGDPILQEQLDFLIASDVRDVRFRQPQSIEAPRAVGRLLQEWAWWWCVANATQRKHLERLAIMELSIAEQQPSYNVSGPQRWLSVFSRFDDKNPLRRILTAEERLLPPEQQQAIIAQGNDAASPWEHSFVCDGTTAQAAVFQRLGDGQNVARFLTMAVTLSQSIMDCIIEDPITGGPIVITYVKVNPGGAANPPEYFVVPRPGAATNLDGNVDMVYGGISLTWYSGGIFVASNFQSQFQSKAQRIKSYLLQTVRSEREVEWIVGAV